MKTLDEYTIYCTEEQTKKALELGASIEVTKRLEPLVNRKYISDLETYTAIIIPTAEEMIGWLEENTEVKRINIVRGIDEHYYWDIFTRKKIASSYSGYTDGDFSRKDATLDAIDKALEYLSNQIK